MQAFKKSSDLNFNLTLKEESYYNYAKLSYELNLPFDNTLKVLTSYNKIFNNISEYLKNSGLFLFIQSSWAIKLF